MLGRGGKEERRRGFRLGEDGERVKGGHRLRRSGHYPPPPPNIARDAGESWVARRFEVGDFTAATRASASRPRGETAPRRQRGPSCLHHCCGSSHRSMCTRVRRAVACTALSAPFSSPQPCGVPAALSHSVRAPLDTKYRERAKKAVYPGRMRIEE
ncbi:hypothetical protein MRX96_000631 [Rhipicephalus microplus]